MTSLGNKTLPIWIINIRGRIGIYTKTLPFLSTHGSCIIWMMCFIFQDVGEVNGIQIPSTIGIQTPSQMQSMFSLGKNGAILMDATFETNDVKLHLFTLMVFDAHWSSVPVTWIKHVMIWWNGSFLWRKNCKIICQDGNVHVLLLMMIKKIIIVGPKGRVISSSKTHTIIIDP